MLDSNSEGCEFDP